MINKVFTVKKSVKSSLKRAVREERAKNVKNRN